MFGDFFGGYLVIHDIITADQLEEAITAQRENRVLLGALAMGRMYVTDDDLRDLLVKQVKEHRKLGELLIESGLCTAEQLRELLEEQAKNHVYLGEALVRLKILDLPTLNRHLDTFEKRSQTFAEQLQCRIDPVLQKDLIYLALDVVRSFFFRRGYVVKVGAVEASLPQEIGDLKVFSAEHRRSGGRVGYFGLALPISMMLLMLDRTNLNENFGSYGNEIETEYFEEVFFNMNYAICRQSRCLNMRVNHGPTQAAIPEARPVLSIRLQGAPELVYVLYFPD